MVEFKTCPVRNKTNTEESPIFRRVTPLSTNYPMTARGQRNQTFVFANLNLRLGPPLTVNTSSPRIPPFCYQCEISDNYTDS